MSAFRSPGQPRQLLTAGVTVIVLGLVPLAGTAHLDAIIGEATPVAAVAADPAPQPTEGPEVTDTRLADAGGVQLHLTGDHRGLIGFHQASYDDAMTLTPAAGDLPAAVEVADGQTPPANVVQLPSRGRPTTPTSAVDIVYPPGVPVMSPVTGVVAELRPYRLYDRYDDVRIELIPDDAPDRRVVIIHVTDVAVAVGDRVTAGQTPIAHAAQFGFVSQIDRFSGHAGGHVHVEVKAHG